MKNLLILGCDDEDIPTIYESMRYFLKRGEPSSIPDNPTLAQIIKKKSKSSNQ